MEHTKCFGRADPQAAFCCDSEPLRRLFGRGAGGRKAHKWDEGEAFLTRNDDGDDRMESADELHPGLEAAFKHVEKLEANMKHKHSC